MSEVLQPEVMLDQNSSTAIMAYEKAQIDTQIATAKQYPMHNGALITKVKQEMLSLATLDTETAESCFYTLPRGQKKIQGPSVRLAEIAVSCYGNIKVGTRILETVSSGESPHVTVQALCHDLERNTSVCIEKRRRIVSKLDYRTNTRKPIDEDDINLATNACSAIAFRDAAFKIIPLALVKPVFEQAKKVAIGDAKTLSERRLASIDKFAKMGVSKEQVCSLVGKRSVEDIDLADMETLLGVYTAIRDGELSIDDAFAKKTVEAAPVASDTLKDKKARQQLASTQQPSTQQPEPPAAVDTKANAEVDPREKLVDTEEDDAERAGLIRVLEVAGINTPKRFADHLAAFGLKKESWATEAATADLADIAKRMGIQ